MGLPCVFGSDFTPFRRGCDGSDIAQVGACLTPLCPAGHLPLKGGDHMGLFPNFYSHLFIFLTEGKKGMKGKPQVDLPP
ncbi:hypothetical protein RvVAR0630_02950 [Agrobacterium vitis]|nr:hypothetical protein RvVAR0630_02950 [Agrobacterium vitis]